MSDEARVSSTIHRAILDWIKDDAGIAIKVSITPDQANALSSRILAAIQPDPEPQPVAAAICKGCGQEFGLGAPHVCQGPFATPSSAGMVSVEAAALENLEDEMHETYREMLLGKMPTNLEVYAWITALRALRGSDGEE